LARPEKEKDTRPDAKPDVKESVERTPVSRIAPTTKDNWKKTDELLAVIRKKFGPTSIGRLGEYDTNVKVFPTGLPSLDKIMGVGGFPLAKLVQIQGAESVGKTALINYLAAQAQRQGIVVYFLDGEQNESNDRATSIGVNTDLLTISEPDTLEESFQMMDTAITRMKTWSSPSLIMLDSLAALPLQSDLERGYDELSQRAGRALFLSGNLKKLLGPLKDTQIGIVFVNQVREKANVTNPYEKKTYSPGGRAPRHHSDVILELTRFGSKKQGIVEIGITSRIRVEKSRISPPHLSTLVNIYHDGRFEEAEPKEGRDE
jgi:recombination protein RecA